MKTLSITIAALLLTACSTSSNLKIGNESSLSSLKDQREANKSVRVYKTLPKGAKVLEKVEASRCHRQANQSQPTNENVIQDLKIAAYSKGADGITRVQISKGADLISNCWYVLNGTATSFSLSK